MFNALAVLVGGGLGSLARFGVGLAVQACLGGPSLWGSLAVTVSGCFLMGLLAGLTPDLAQSAQARARLIFGVGVLGGFTTFSAFGLETYTLLEQRQVVAAAGNLLANTVLGLAAIGAGMLVGRSLG